MTASGKTDAIRDAEGALRWREAGVWHIDVRGLPPPRPMLAVLRLLDEADAGDAVVFHHDREPIHLFPELAERGWAWAAEAGAAGEVRLRFSRTRR